MVIVLSVFNVNFSAFCSVYIVCISWNIKEIFEPFVIVKISRLFVSIMFIVIAPQENLIHDY